MDCCLLKKMLDSIQLISLKVFNLDFIKILPIPLQPGYLNEVYYHVKATVGDCIVDEVQAGFGRVGAIFWGFELQDGVPLIVVM